MKESFQRIVSWVKAHPWLAALILAGVLLLGYLAYRRSVLSGQQGSNLQAGAPEAGAAGGAAGELPAATPLQEPSMIPGAEIQMASLPSFGGFDFGGGGGRSKIPAGMFTTTPVMPIAATTTVSPTSEIGAGETLLQASASQFWSGAQLESILNTPAGQVPTNLATGFPLNIFTGNLQYNPAEVLPSRIIATGPIPPKVPAVPGPTMTQQTNPFIGNIPSPSLSNMGGPTKPRSPKPAPGASGPATVQAGSLLAAMGSTVGSVATNPFVGSAVVKSSPPGGGAKNAAPTRTNKPAPISTKSQDRKVERMK